MSIISNACIDPPYLSSQGLLLNEFWSTCTSISTEGWSPTVPERWPLRPSASDFVFWSLPNDSSPGPISTRLPSMVSTNQQPESGTIHCGFGFSCHSPTQPTGRTMMIMWVPGLLSRSTHDGAAPLDILSSLKSVSRICPDGLPLSRQSKRANMVRLAY